MIIACWVAFRASQIFRVQAVTLASALGRRQLGLDDRPVAGKDVSSAGDDGAGIWCCGSSAGKSSPL